MANWWSNSNRWFNDIFSREIALNCENMNLKNKKVLVMGLGLIGGGVDIVKWLNKNGAEIIVTDLKSKEELKSSIKKLEGIPIEFVLGQHRKSDFRNVDLVIKNSSIPDDSFYLKVSRSKNIPIETDISLFFKLWNRKSIIGITGTKGKSTTANLVYRILKLANFNVRLAGNIGKSPLRYLGKITKDAKFVLELSSWQLRSLRKEKISPHISVITNIFPDHLNYYKKLSSYIADKKLIFNFQSENDWLVLNYENKSLRNIVEKVQSQIVFFSKKV
ncbi:UDP-N-acetylmuramoyl-L-alanine--D-glutamate ligase, partial [bacterium]|nr:UDP-N-acetylmuramoyl-L-alanine--D-glutamate ligase [bacterium]